ncbi:MAG: cellulase family glycosylhydrolase, partial [candidate division WOR-3 bacterium]
MAKAQGLMPSTNPAKTETWANEAYANNQFNKMKTKFIDKGYAVILGEYGAQSRLNLGSDQLNAEHAEYRRYYMYYITYALVRHGLVPFYWDNGYTGDHGMGVFNRSTGAQAYPKIIKAIIDGVAAGTVKIDQEEHTKTPRVFLLHPNYP